MTVTLSSRLSKPLSQTLLLTHLPTGLEKLHLLLTGARLLLRAPPLLQRLLRVKTRVVVPAVSANRKRKIIP
jgi:hypothetical protein